MFTAGNMAAGYYAISQAIQGTANDPWHFDQAAKAIGFAIVLDFFDGGIARLTNTASAFGRELDSLADVIAFGVAPAVLAWMWGFRMLPHGRRSGAGARTSSRSARSMTFAFLLSGASRLARFNIQVNPQPSNPGRPGRKYFVGMPIPAGAGAVAAVVHLVHGNPLQIWWLSIGWGVFVSAIVLSDGEHLALLQPEGNQLSPAAEFSLADRHRPGDRADLVCLTICLVRAGAHLYSFRRDRAALLCIPPADSAASTASGRGLSRLMKNDTNIPSTVRSEGGHWGGLFRVAIVGAATLKGRELKEVLSDRNFPSQDVRLLDDDESLGQLEAVGDEPTFIQSVLPEHLDNIDFTFFAADENFTRETWQMARKKGSDIIDLSYALEGEPGVLLRAPWVERELGTVPKVDFSGGDRGGCSSRSDRAGSADAARAESWQDCSVRW